MNNETQKNKRIIKNTLFLYLRMFILMGISLYTSRVILNTLGVEDYGIYNVIAGFVTMFGLISNSLSSAISRFLNISMGKNNKAEMQSVFSSSVNIQLILAITVLVIAEIVGPWFIATKMTIPAERLIAAIWVFHCSIIAFAINLVSLPYNACIIAHENMTIYAYLSILEAILKLVIVYVLVVFSIDKLQLYAILTLIVAIIIRCTYQLYCKKHYEESIHKWYIDGEMIKKMFGFASWNIVGNASVILSKQGVNILINIFCNPLVNAANGIATQVNNVIYGFATNFMTALNPQITQSYASGDMKRYHQLVENGAKYCVCLLVALSIPFLIETNYILSIWLKIVPEFSGVFVQLILLLTISEGFTNTYTTALLATGKIKWVMIFVAGVRLLNFPLSYFCLRIWGNPILTFLVSIALSQGCQYIRLMIMKRNINISITNYTFKILLPQCFILAITYIGTKYGIQGFFQESFIRLLICLICAEIIYLILIFSFILSKSEKIYIKQFLINKIYGYIKKHA